MSLRMKVTHHKIKISGLFRVSKITFWQDLFPLHALSGISFVLHLVSHINFSQFYPILCIMIKSFLQALKMASNILNYVSLMKINIKIKVPFSSIVKLPHSQFKQCKWQSINKISAETQKRLKHSWISSKSSSEIGALLDYTSFFDILI